MVVVWMLVCQSLCVLPAVAAPAVAREPVYRHLFVVDTSFSMGSRSEQVRESVYELVRSGCQGTMRPGDPFGIWTFAEEMETAAFVRLHWDPPLNQLFANKAYQFLSQLEYRKQTRLDRAMVQLQALIREADDLTVYLYTDGEDALTGTPFDTQIRAEFERRRRELRRARMPFVTLLRVRGGEVIVASVFAADKVVVPVVDPGRAPATKAAPLAVSVGTAVTPAPSITPEAAPVVQPQPAIPQLAPPATVRVAPSTPPPKTEPAASAATVTPPQAQAVEPPRTPLPRDETPKPSPAAPSPAPSPASTVENPAATIPANSVPTPAPIPTSQPASPRVVADPVASAPVVVPPASVGAPETRPVGSEVRAPQPSPATPVVPAADASGGSRAVAAPTLAVSTPAPAAKPEQSPAVGPGAGGAGAGVGVAPARPVEPVRTPSREAPAVTGAQSTESSRPSPMSSAPTASRVPSSGAGSAAVAGVAQAGPSVGGGGGWMFLVGGGVFLGVACGLAALWLRGRRAQRRVSSVISRSMERDPH